MAGYTFCKKIITMTPNCCIALVLVVVTRFSNGQYHSNKDSELDHNISIPLLGQHFTSPKFLALKADVKCHWNRVAAARGIDS